MAAITFPSYTTIGSAAVTEALSTNFQQAYWLLSEPRFTQRQSNAIGLVGLINLIKILGDTKDYSVAGGHGQAISDAQVFSNQMSRFNLRVALNALFVFGGKIAVAGQSTDLNSLLATGSDFAALPEQTQDAIMALFLYRGAL